LCGIAGFVLIRVVLRKKRTTEKELSKEERLRLATILSEEKTSTSTSIPNQTQQIKPQDVSI